MPRPDASPFTSLNALCFAKERPPARIEPAPAYVEFSLDGVYWVQAGIRGGDVREVCETTNPAEAVEALLRVLN